jgi:hypothetical protein
MRPPLLPMQRIELCGYPSMSGSMQPFGRVPYGLALGIANAPPAGPAADAAPCAFDTGGEDALMPVSEPSISGR